MKSQEFAFNVTCAKGARVFIGKFKNGVKIKRKRADKDRGLA